MKRNMKQWTFMIIFSVVIIALGTGVQRPQVDKIQFKRDTTDFSNPERGFYRATITYASQYDPLSSQVIRPFTKQHVPFEQAGYTINCSLVHRVFVLDGYQEKPLSADLLEKISQDFAVAREEGVKLIIRFCYNFTPAPDFSPPYKDASLPIVTTHIKQLAPVIEANKDIIAVIQQGFIGLWGEGYYSDHFGIPGNYNQQQIKDRAKLLQTMLSEWPKELMIQVRTPTAFQDYKRLYGTELNRIGFHNDAFLGSEDDLGTFRSYDVNPAFVRKNTPDALRSYVRRQMTNVVGGETSTFNPPMCKCQVEGGIADRELAAYGYSYLNSTYNEKVLASWRPCIDDIKKKLGYRFYLKDISLPLTIARGSNFSFRANIVNEGYASVYNARTVYLVLSNEAGLTYFFPFRTDIKSWKPGNTTLNEKLTITKQVLKGTYRVSLYLPDANKKISSRPAYAIRFANLNMWNGTNGFNDLSARLTVQ
ncbi:MULTISPECIES: DUF4832 domain-containing protein [Olivibacter]|uniref:DUF4832 domain-containing protein n=1 Tax=Olivibacter jilunii TaxID=985016 RepID=A0ABW6B773_9SPHI|nr:DUF4832 domain-containing protein [Olivibacter sp. UJ_SKK_5.1]MDX3912662.1 DUF4832 domain-containing protein [Pseudosphingobacterium sp.]